MSLKTADKKPGFVLPSSLAARMTLWYALSAFALVLIASGFLYRALSESLAHEDDILLDQNFQSLSQLMKVPSSDLEDLKEFAGELPKWFRNPSFWVRILDGDRVLAETPGMARSLPPPVFRGQSRDGRSSMVRSGEGKPFLVLSTSGVWPGHQPGRVSIQMAFDMGFDANILETFREKLLALLTFSILSCALAGYLIAHRGIRPLRKMAESAAQIKSSTLNERLDLSGLPSELSDLTRTFNEMLDRLEDSFARLSCFSSDIAHELRTPLQNLRGEAEVVLSKERLPEEYREILGSALEEYSRLSNLIDRLLFLARAENPKTQVQREPLDIQNELGILQDFYGLSAGESGIALRVEAPGGMKADLDRSLFQQAVGNLVENALKHTSTGGTILIRSSNGDGKVRLEVADTGRGIPPDQLVHVFDRFYRVDFSRSPAAGGAGLGLSIVKSIMDLHGGTVEIRSEPAQGTTVTLLFPADKSVKC